MNDKINDAVEEVKLASIAYQTEMACNVALKEKVDISNKSLASLREVVEAAEKKLRGAIYEETQG